MAAAYLAPTLAHGTKLGPFDFLGIWGLGSIPGTVPHNAVSSDQIQQMMPWTVLDWTQVHHGHLPLWNPYSGLGMPLAFNFQSAPFGLPSLVGYLVPMRFAYTVGVVVKVLIAGTGVMAFCRAMGSSVLAAAFAGTIFEVSGAFTAWLGWPQAGVLCWLGWALAATVLILHGRHRVLGVGLFAVVLAFAVYGGHPESIAFLVGVVGLFSAIVALGQGWGKGGERGPVLRPVRDLCVGGLAGLALGAPLLLPGVEVVVRSVRGAAGPLYQSLPPTSVVDFVFGGFHGFPIAGSVDFGPGNYYEMAAYVGGTALVLAVLAALCGWRDRRVVALVVISALLGTIVYVGAVGRVIDTIPVVGGLLWRRLLIPLDMTLAALAAFGLDTVRRQGHQRDVQWRLAAVVGLSGATIAAVWWAHVSAHLPAAEAAEQRHAFLWPTVQAGVEVLVVVALLLGYRKWRGTWIKTGSCLALVGVEAVFLVLAAPNLWASSPQVFTATPAEAALQRTVGTGRVGFGACPAIDQLPNLGILPEANDAYGVAEFAAYDPVIPRTYLRSWDAATGINYPMSTAGNFCPSVTTAALARRYGVSYVLEPPGAPGPAGTVHLATLDGEGLFAVPGSGVVTLLPAGVPGDSAAADVPSVQGPNPGSRRVVVDPAQASTLFVHITDLPGWGATIDGHPLALRTWSGTMLQASIPAGRHVVVLTYRPAAFEVGLVIAAVAAVGLTVFLVLLSRRRRPVELREPVPEEGRVLLESGQ